MNIVFTVVNQFFTLFFRKLKTKIYFFVIFQNATSNLVEY